MLARERCFALLVALPLVTWSTTTAAESGERTATFRVAGTFGVDAWSDLGDVQPFLGGSFDDAGFAIDLAFHWPVGHLGPATVLLGGNLGGFFHDSSVTGVEEGEDLQASVVYLTPSLKFAFGNAGGRRFYVDAGIGYYGAAIDELEEDCFFGCDAFEYYDDQAVGGYVGASADFPFGSRPGGMRLTAAAQVHFIDFDDPVALDGAASLGGPIYTVNVGVAWGR